jgi:hypothetical protein
VNFKQPKIRRKWWKTPGIVKYVIYRLMARKKHIKHIPGYIPCRLLLGSQLLHCHQSMGSEQCIEKFDACALRRRRGHNHTNLPSDIWQIIARYLRPQGWATVAGTCKTTWELQLDTVHIRQVARTLLSNEKPLCGAGEITAGRMASQLGMDIYDLLTSVMVGGFADI